MKLIPVEIKYACGTIIRDHATLDVRTKEVFIPPRLSSILAMMEKTEALPSTTVILGGRAFHIELDEEGGYRLPAGTRPLAGRGAFRSIVTPNRAQRIANGRFAHLLSGASLTYAIFSLYSVRAWTVSSIVDIASYVISGLLLGVAGFYCKMEQ
jgi:hypothetical protein